MTAAEEKTLNLAETELRSIIGNILLTVGLLILPKDERARLAKVIEPHTDTEINLLSITLPE